MQWYNMSTEKYALNLTRWNDGYKNEFNAKGEVPAPWTVDMQNSGIAFVPETMANGYDENG